MTENSELAISDATASGSHLSWIIPVALLCALMLAAALNAARGRNVRSRCHATELRGGRVARHPIKAALTLPHRRREEGRKSPAFPK